MEAADAGIELIVCITEGVPVLDMTRVLPVREGEAARGCSARTARASSRRASRKVGIIPGHICTPGTGRRRQPLGHADLRGRLPAHARRHRPDHLRRHRRRPDQRHELHRLPRGVRGGPGHEGRRDDRRDRRHRRAGGRRVREGAHEEAGRRLHRRPDRAAGPPDGPRRRDHLRIGRHGGGEDRGVREGRHGRREAARSTSSELLKARM